jgi:molybdenum cofactor synthesis domain-containing protein
MDTGPGRPRGDYLSFFFWQAYSETMNLTACLVVIGNEVLSGRTQDANTVYIARRLGEIGMPLREVRVIPDVPDRIIATINEVRARYDHVFTTGGIGPTHDDITSECIAAAFGVPWEKQPEVWARMEAYYAPGMFNTARQRMATMPRGAVLIDDGHIAPGFSIGNVHVMAGVPAIMRKMFEALAPRLPAGSPVVSRSLHGVGVQEGDIAAGLTEIQARHEMLDIGSYPYYRDGSGGVAIVAKGTDAAAAEAAIGEVAALFRSLGADPVAGEPG